jgi:hypothetical protein
LAAQRQAATMPNPTITAKVHQALDIHRYLAPEVTFDREFTHLSTETIDLVFAQRTDGCGSPHLCGLADSGRPSPPDPIDRCQGNDRVFSVWNIDSGDSSHARCAPKRSVLSEEKV